jgi:dihydroorotate dehydrogenase (fumarate)
MADLTTRFIGLELKNPLIAGASGLTSNINSIKKLEDAGAAALVTKSLFEEQIELEKAKLEAELHKNDNLYSEMLSLFPNIEHGGPKAHLMWVRRTREAVSIPVIASLNAVSKDTWVEYASKLAETGVNGLELNFYASPRSMDDVGVQIEEEQVDILKAVRKAVSLPLCVKLSPFYTNPLKVIQCMDEAGADGFVLFNRLFQPDIDVDQEKNIFPLGFSGKTDNRLPLRYSGLLYDKIKGGICASSGVMDGEDVAKMILAGADAVQVVTTLYKNGVDHIETMLRELSKWMDKKNYRSLSDFRGKMSRARSTDPWVYTRSQYARLLLQPGEKLMKEIT